MGSNLHAAQNGADVLRVLLIGCESHARSEIAAALVDADMFCTRAATTAEAAALLQWRIPDFVLLDWTLPGTANILAKLKSDRQRHHIPVIALGTDETDEVVSALQAGADDFIAKPFAVREMIARIRAVRRRVNPLEGSESLSCGALHMDALRRRVYLGERELMLGELEYRLLALFLKRPHRAHSRAEILQWVWGGRTIVDERSIDARIRALRASLGEGEGGYGKYIVTVRGVGYCFAAGHDLPVRSARHSAGESGAASKITKRAEYLALLVCWLTSFGESFVAVSFV